MTPRALFQQSTMYRHRPPRQTRRPERTRRTSCLSRTVILGVVVLLLAVGYVQFVRPNLGAFVGDMVSRQVGGQQATPGGGQPPIIEEQVDTHLPDAIRALPRGEVRVSDTQINDYIAANAEQLAPFEQVTMRFVPGQIEADLVAYGMQNHVTLGLTVANGQVAVVNPQLEGPLNLILSFEDVTRSLERELNSQLASEGRVVRDIRIEQGTVVAVVE